MSPLPLLLPLFEGNFKILLQNRWTRMEGQAWCKVNECHGLSCKMKTFKI